MNKRFEEVEHTADIAIRVWGRDLGQLFANAAYGMACQLADPDRVQPRDEYRIELEADDTEWLLVNWLSELLYLGERDTYTFTDFDMLEVTPTRLQAIARGGPVEEYEGHIKAVTFSELEIIESDEGYETTIVFDV
jgi:SHS2 domain-containing protein